MKRPSSRGVRTAILVAVGVFMLLWMTVVSEEVQVPLVIAALTCCGLGPVLTLEDLVRGKLPPPPPPPPPVPPALPPVQEVAP